MAISGQGVPASGGFNLPRAGAMGAGAFSALMGINTDRPDFNNPANAARPYFEKIPQTLNPYFQPYIDQGQRASSTLENQYGSMASNPAEFLSNIGQNYKSSPGYQWNLSQALNAGNNAAAAGGMLGTPSHVQNNEMIGENLANQDYENWLNHALNIFSGGQGGLQGLYNTGYGASTGYGSSIASALMNQGLLEQRGVEAQNKYNQDSANAESSGWGDLAGLAFSALPYLAM